MADDNLMDYKMTDKGIQLAILKLSTENNAFLRMMLSNQIKIMQKLGAEPDVTMPFTSMISNDQADKNAILKVFLKASEEVEKMVTTEVFDWVQFMEPHFTKHNDTTT